MASYGTVRFRFKQMHIYIGYTVYIEYKKKKSNTNILKNLFIV